MKFKKYAHSSFILIITDQLVKLIVVKFKIRSFPLIKGLVEVEACTNQGFSFSLLNNLTSTNTLYIHTVCLILILMYLFFNSINSQTVATARNFIIAGAISNYIDRVYYGCIIDMLKLIAFKHTLFICNLADIYLSIGVCLIFTDYTFTNKTLSKFKKYGLERDNFGL